MCQNVRETLKWIQNRIKEKQKRNWEKREWHPANCIFCLFAVMKVSAVSSVESIEFVCFSYHRSLLWRNKACCSVLEIRVVSSSTFSIHTGLVDFLLETKCYFVLVKLSGFVTPWNQGKFASNCVELLLFVLKTSGFVLKPKTCFAFGQFAKQASRPGSNEKAGAKEPHTGVQENKAGCETSNSDK